MAKTNNERTYSKIWDFQLSRATVIAGDCLVHLALLALFLCIQKMWARLAP